MAAGTFLFVKFIFVLYFLLPNLLFAAETSTYKWSGDFRLRGQSEETLLEEYRVSEKLRLRFGLKVQIQPDLKAEIRLATAKSNTSTNQTIGDNKEPGFARRSIGVDLGYVSWQGLPFLRFDAGKIPQVHFRPGGSQVLLDSDLSLEGIDFVSEYSVRDWLDLFASTGSTWIRENYDSYYSTELTDNMLNWAQVGLKFRSGKCSTQIGLGFFNFTSLQGAKFADVSIGGTARGNTDDGSLNYKNNFVPKQFFLDSKFKTAGINWNFFLEHIVNDQTRDPNKAFWVGFSASSSLLSGQISYGSVQSDSVPGIFTDSDFAAGNTNSKGVVLTSSWKFKSGMSLAISQYINRRRATSGLNDTHYNRTHLDLNASF